MAPAIIISAALHPSSAPTALRQHLPANADCCVCCRLNHQPLATPSLPPPSWALTRRLQLCQLPLPQGPPALGELCSQRHLAPEVVEGGGDVLCPLDAPLQPGLGLKDAALVGGLGAVTLLTQLGPLLQRRPAEAGITGGSAGWWYTCGGA